VLGAAAALWVVVACLDISSPISGISSISFVMPATPSVVRGDSLRDTAGVVQPLRVDAFGPNGEKLTNVTVRFYVIDTANQLHVVDTTGIVTAGDTLSPNAAVFARVWSADGKSFLDTPLDTIPVVPRPDSATSDTNFTFVFDATASDTGSSALITPPFGVTVRGQADTVIPRYVVAFDLIRAPVPKSPTAGPSVVLTSSLSTAESTYAVTDASGRATIRLRLRVPALPASLFIPGAVDTAVVRFRVRYHGDTLPVSQSDSIIITLQSK
jgi:hypothetical protein